MLNVVDVLFNNLKDLTFSDLKRSNRHLHSLSLVISNGSSGGLPTLLSLILKSAASVETRNLPREYKQLFLLKSLKINLFVREPIIVIVTYLLGFSTFQN